MYEKIEKCKSMCLWGLLIISLLISPLIVNAGQISTRGEQTVSGTAREKLRTRISYSCKESPIEKVLMDLAEQANIDIIKSPDINGTITVKVTDVPLEEALTNILAVHNWTYIATESMVRIIPLPEISELKEQRVTKIYQITYADVNQVFAALDEFVTAKGEVAINKGTSHVMVTDTEDKMKAVDKFIEHVDRPTQQVLVEVRIYDVTTKEGFELDPKWNFGRNAPYTPGTFQTPKEITETVIGPESSYYREDRREVQWGNPYLYPYIEGAGVTDSWGIAERSETQLTEDYQRGYDQNN